MTQLSKSTYQSGLLQHRKVSLLLGAGFSKWSCNLPLVSELFDFDMHAGNLSEENRVSKLQKTYDNWKIANPTANNETFIAFMHATNSNARLVNWYITRRLTEPFIIGSYRRRTWYINSYRVSEHEGIRKARNFLNNLTHENKIGILTTNYDFIVEYALTSHGFNYGIRGELIGHTPYPYIKKIFATGDIPIAKLHGSISWTEYSKHLHINLGISGKCLIVPPTAQKLPHVILADQWDLGKKLLRNSETLLVFGFAFNEYDSAIREFIANNANPKLNVILIDVVDHSSRLRGIFPTQQLNFLDAQSNELEQFIFSEIKRGNHK